MNHGTRTIDLSNIRFTPKLLATIPAEIARRYHVIPVCDSLESLGIAIAEPADWDAIDAVQVAVRRNIEIFHAGPLQLTLLIERCYGRLD